MIGRIDLVLPDLPIGLILRRRVFKLIDEAVAILETTQVMVALTPFGQILGVAALCTSLNGFANRIPLQVDLSGEMHVGFAKKGIIPFLQWFFAVILTPDVPRTPLPG